MKIKNMIFILTSIIMLMLFTSCEMSDSIHMTIPKSGAGDEDIQLAYEALIYDNAGNNYAAFRGNSFTIKPNKVKQWGYNTNGSWESWYETSSVVSIEIDGHNIQSCGSSVIFKDSRLEILPFQNEIGEINTADKSEYSVEVPAENFKNYFSLKHWWYDLHENGQGGAKIVLIQSQDGYNIGAIEGNNVTWEVAEKLPKTTLIKVDDMPLYIHRCNFMIIDTALFDNVSS